MNLDAAMQTFIAECAEMLSQMEDLLLQLETNPNDSDVLNAIFRCAHTIKGTAGVFGLDGIVEFTHRVESLLDRMRAGELVADSNLIALLLACRDHMQVLVGLETAGRSIDAETDAGSRRLGDELDKAMGLGTASTRAPGTTNRDGNRAGAAVESTDGLAQRSWHISVRFGREVLRNGMDPLSFIRYLRKLGEIEELVLLADSLPEPEAMDPEQCYLGFEIALRSNATREQIESVFDFVRDDCVLRVLSPDATVEEYIDLIRSLPEDDLRLGEILVRCGAVTETELQHALEQQNVARLIGADSKGASPLGEVLVNRGSVAAEVVDAALVRQTAAREVPAKSRSIRVDADRLDQLIDLVGELVIASAGTELTAARCKAVEVVESAATLTRLVEDIRGRALALRMVPIGETFQKFQRVVRDVGRELGKEIELVIKGGETELDKSVVEKIGDPLMHLVRNALDHGIKTPEYRVARGKPPRGTLTLSAYHDSGSIVIDVSDDGAGLPREKILAKARERGLVPENVTPSDYDIDQLIFEPGFSTADQVSNISGRGVGMDVVKRNVEALRGTVRILTTPGKGTTVRVTLPLTLAIIDGFLIKVNNDHYVIPLDMLIECIELTPPRREAASARGYIDLRGKVLPCVWLRDVFGLEGQPQARENVVVVQFGGLRAGLVVDELHGEVQSVIKPLGAMFKSLSGIVGASILGTGEVALIVDVPALIHRCAARSHEIAAAS